MTRCLLMLALLFAGSARAETVQVRSGEHPGFSRLVLALDTPSEWTFFKIDGGYRLRFVRKDITPDTSGIFRLIPRDRIADAIAEPDGSLRLEVNCACHSESFEVSEGRIVIDIRDGADGETAPSEPAANTDVIARPAFLPLSPRATGAVDLGWAEAAAAPRTALPVMGTFLPASSERQSENSLHEAEPHPAPLAAVTNVSDRHAIEQSAGEETSQPSDAELTALRDQILKQLSRAATQGLVSPDVELPSLPTDVRPAQAQHEPPERLAPPPPDGAPGLRIQTSVDRDRPDRPAPLQTSEGRNCPPERFFDLPAWGGDHTPATLIAMRRTGVVEEFDRVNAQRLDALIRAYLHIGFGAEARALRNEMGVDLPGAPYYAAIARIVDGETPHPQILPAETMACDTPVAMWAVLAHPDLSKGTAVNTGAVLSAFSALPLPLRHHLGDDLVKRFTGAGDRQTASQLRNAVLRAPGEAGPEAEMMQAYLDISVGHQAKADHRLKEIAQQDRVHGAEALALLLETRNAGGIPADGSDLASADALATEYRGTPLGARLQRAWAISSAYSGDFATAFTALGQAEGENRTALAIALADTLTTRGPDAAFLRYTLALIDSEDAQALPADLSTRAAERLSGLGFVEPAETLLGPPGSDEAAARIQLRARLALQAAQPAIALRLLAGLQGEAPDRMRADAYAALGQTAIAARLYRAAGATDRQGAVAWQQADWPVILRHGDGAQKRFAGTRLSPLLPPGGAPALEGARQLAESSGLLRAAAQALLNVEGSGS